MSDFFSNRLVAQPQGHKLNAFDVSFPIHFECNQRYLNEIVFTHPYVRSTKEEGFVHNTFHQGRDMERAMRYESILLYVT